MLDVGINLRKDRRRARLGQLLDELRNAGMNESEVAKELNTSKAHLSAIKRGHKNIGDALAARIETRFGKPEGWMDQQFDAPRVADNAGVRDALLILANALTAAGEIGRMKVAGILGKLCDVDHSTRLRYVNAIADELGDTGPVTRVSWEAVCRESLALLDESTGKQKVMAYIELVDLNYQHIVRQASRQNATQD